MTPWTLHHGDCLDVLRGMETASVDAIVTDPPAGIAFMGKGWDGDKGGRRQWIAWLAEVMGECRRVAKPGGHALVWALPRTSHWTATAMEDAGWDVRDRLHHIQGAGFPKGTNISKAIDRAAGAEREVVGPGARHASRAFGAGTGDPALGSFAGGVPPATSPATPEAARWEGWNTALKPAAEDWWLCRAPLTEDTIAGNVLRWGTGAINVDGCRVATGDNTARPQGRDIRGGAWGGGVESGRSDMITGGGAGRWPANLLLSHQPACEAAGPCAPGCVVAALDAQSGERAAPRTYTRSVDASGGVLGRSKPRGMSVPGYADTGGASRFYPTFAWEADDFVPFLYCPKASRSDRTAGGTVPNVHPTVKSTALLRWLSRLICPPGGLILDPFAGSGTGGVAALLEGFRWVGIEREAEYLPIIEARLAHAEGRAARREPAQASLFGGAA